MKVIFPGTIKRFLLAVGLVLAVSALAHGGSPDTCGGIPGEGMPPHLRGLKLSESQRDKVFELMHAQAPALRDKAKTVHRTEEALRTLAASPDYSEAKARAQADALAKAISEMTLARARTDRQIVEWLTPEQRKQLAEQAGKPPMR